MRGIQNFGSGLKPLVQDCTCLTHFVGSGLGQDFLVTPLTYGVEVISKKVMENRVGILPQGGGQRQRIIPHTAELKRTAWKFEGSNG